MSTDADDVWVIWDSNPNAKYTLCVFAHHLGASRWLSMVELKAGYRPHGTKREHVEEYVKRYGHDHHKTTWSIVRLPDALALLDMRLAREAAGV